MCYNSVINTKQTVDELIESFLKKGGRIDKYYLRDWNKNKRVLIYLNGWISGKNMSEALQKALY